MWLKNCSFSAAAPLTTQQSFPTGWRESLLQFGAAVGGCTKTLPSIPSPPITKSTRSDMHAHVGGMAHTCMHMMRAHAHRSRPIHSHKYSLGLTLNKWSIHLSARNVPSINRCCLMSRSSVRAGRKMRYNFEKLLKVIQHRSLNEEINFELTEQVKQ